MQDNARLVLPDPLWIVADATLSELGWTLRSEPLVHLAIGMGLAEELRAIQKPVTNWQLGKVLRIDLESYVFPREGQYYTYGDLVRSNYKEWAVQHPESARRLTQ